MSGKTLCANCEYFVMRSGEGECHLNPPILVGRMFTRTVPGPLGLQALRSSYAFPGVSPTDFCSRHIHRSIHNIAPTGEQAVPPEVLDAILEMANREPLDDRPWMDPSDDGGTNDARFEDAQPAQEASRGEEEPDEVLAIDEAKIAKIKVKPPTPKP